MGIDAFDLEVTPERGTPCAMEAPCIAKEETNSFDTDILQFQGDLFNRLSSLMKDLFVLVEGRMNME